MNAGRDFGISPLAQDKPFSNVEFATNPEPRCPCVLLLDTSYSMAGQPLEEMTEGVAQLRRELVRDPLAAKRIELAIVTFGGEVQIQSPFSSVDRFIVPKLTAHSETPMGTAIHTALDLLDERKRMYREHGIAYYRPWVFLVTDGYPTDPWTSAADRIHEGEANQSFLFFVVGVMEADFPTLRKISVRQPLRLRGLEFREMFLWLSSSLSAVSRSRPGQGGQVALEDPAGPDGWADVPNES